MTPSPTPPLNQVDACAGQAKAINDQFIQSLDTTSWVPDTSQAGASASFFFSNEGYEGSLRLKNGALLRSREQLAPTAQKPLRVAAHFLFEQPGDADLPAIQVRAAPR